VSATAQDPKDPKKGEAGSSPVKETPKDDQTVPRGEFIEMRQQLRQALDELNALKAQKDAPTKTEPEPAKAQPTDLEQVRNELTEIRNRDHARNLIEELGLADRKQAQVVMDLLSKNPDLAPAEALELAAKRNADLFKERGTPGFDPRIHGSLRPTPGSQPSAEPKKSDHQARMEHAHKLLKEGRRHEAEEYAIDLIGAAGAKALGWDFKPKPIPTK